MNEINWGDLTLERFLSEFWQQKPILIRGAFEDFKPVIAPDELAGLALEEDVESRLIRYNPSNNDYQLERGPIPEERFGELPEENWTLLVQAVDHYVPEATDLLNLFSFVPRWRIDDLMISYATPGGGVGPHYDNYDVFLIQASGTRRWELGGYEDSNSARLPDAPVMVLSEFESEIEFDLAVGDMLYLPPRLAHNGIATSEDCITYSVGFRAPSESEFLRSISDHVGEQLSAEQRFTDPKRTITATPGQVDVSDAAKIKAKLVELISDEQNFNQWLGELLSEPKYPDMIQPLAEAEFEDWFQEALEVGIEVAPNTRLIYLEADSDRLFCNGEAIPLESKEWPVAKVLADKRTLAPEDIDQNQQELLTKLFKLGALI
jgi:50S ribosomal protein L16 3-hydroxylase